MEETVFFIFTQDSRGLTSPFQRFRPMYNASQKVNCGICGKTLKRSSLRQHLLIHTEERPYGCSGCNASFIRKGDAQRHVRVVHNKVRPFQCDLCSRTFCDKKHLRWHLQNHDKSYFYFCRQCNRKFIKKDYWESHVRFLHNENIEEQNEKEMNKSGAAQLQVDIINKEAQLLKEKESHDNSSFELPDFLNLDVETADLDFVDDTNSIFF